MSSFNSIAKSIKKAVRNIYQDAPIEHLKRDTTPLKPSDQTRINGRKIM
jgi:hypothetical protein